MRTGLLLAIFLLSAPAAFALGGDLNDDGYVNIQDLLSMVQHIGRGKPYSPASDLNGDGAVNIFDLTRVSREWGRDYWLAAPSRTVVGPSGQLPAGAGTAQLQLTTNASANCSYSTSSGALVSGMTPFTSTGGTDHASPVAVQDGRSYTYYVKCRDAEGRTNREGVTISFTTAQAAGGPSALFEDSFETYTAGTNEHAGAGANGFTWVGSRVTISSTDIARTGSQSLEFRYGPFEPDGNSHWWSEQRYDIGQQAQEAWFEFYLYFPDGTEGFSSRYEQHFDAARSNNNKLFTAYADLYESEPLEIYETWTTDASGDQAITMVARTEGNRDGDSVLIRRPSHNPPTTLNGGANGIVSGDDDRGRWIRMRFHVKVADIGVSNGEHHLWKDDALIVQVENDPYWDEGLLNNYIRRGYLLGYDNARFQQNTSIYLDDFKVYLTDPGWLSPIDTTPPLVTIQSPAANEVLAAGTTSATISLSTDEEATCRYSASAGVAYSSMTNTFTTTGGTSHGTSISGLQDGRSYNYSVRCSDPAGNANTDDYTLSFSIAVPASVCGNGVLEAGEQCDTGAQRGSCPATCGLSCTTNTCSSGNALFEDAFDTYSNNASISASGANGFRWYGGARTSRDIAHSGLQSIKFSFGPIEPDGVSTHWWTEQPFSHPPLTEYWVEYYIYYPDGTEGFSARYAHAPNNMNNKFYTFWGGPAGRRDRYSIAPAGNAATWGLGGGDSRIGFVSVGGAWSNTNNRPFIVGDADRGRWMQIRIYMRVATVGASDGIYRLWKDGVLVTEEINEPSYATDPALNYLSNGYLLGYDNANFEQDTFIYIDDFRFYDEDPGWTGQ